MDIYGIWPFGSELLMAEWLAACAQSTDPVFLAVTDHTSGDRVGMVSYLNIVPDAWRLELGNIWYGPTVQRTCANTESIYLMLCESFDQLGYRRVEWKCDALNAKSRAAATRLGFSFEGIFRQHLIYKGRNRDTAWFSMLDAEWQEIKQNIERWLYENEDGHVSLTQLNAS
jgi:RimJ/RimL family protein N-acetyltransferase